VRRVTHLHLGHPPPALIDRCTSSPRRGRTNLATRWSDAALSVAQPVEPRSSFLRPEGSDEPPLPPQSFFTPKAWTLMAGAWRLCDTPGPAPPNPTDPEGVDVSRKLTHARDEPPRRQEPRCLFAGAVDALARVTRAK
jgi:hypothetical protein